MQQGTARRYLGFLLACCATAAAGASTPLESVFESIRGESARVPAGADGRRLPLAASWNQGNLPLGFSPAYQIAQIDAGHYLLPWFGLSVPRPPAGATSNYPASTDAPDYYTAAIRYLAAHHLPLSFVTTQFEALLSDVSADYPQRTADGKAVALTPFGPVEPWQAVGKRWAQHPTLKRLQQLYPDPPLVLFISNNERSKLGADDLHASYSPTASAQLLARRRAIGDAWILRYRALEHAWRAALDAPAWRAHAVFVGYDAFVSSALGRWGGWPQYSLCIPGRLEPWPAAWNGASVSYYVHDWAPDSDFTVWSPEVEAMNYVPALAQVRRSQPNFWFELSSWDGQLPGRPTDKRLFYQQRGQELTATRYAGMVQFGMWLLRPRVVREFRNPEDDRVHFGRYFEALMAAVARVHEQATLRSFWRHGELVANPAGGHPYQAALPADLAQSARWFLLDADLNPARPWELTTALRVYALALQQGSAPQRRWLGYAFSPRDETLSTEVQIPQGPRVRVPAGSAGAFALVSEDGSVRPLTSNTAS